MRHTRIELSHFVFPDCEVFPALCNRSGILSVHEDEPLIPAPFDQNPCAHWRRPMDMILQGWSTSLFHASQQWSTRSS